MSKRLMPTYLINFLKEIYDGTIPSNFGKRMVSRQFIARVKELYETLGCTNPSDYSRRMVNEYLIKFFNEIEIVEYTDDDVLMTKTIPSDLVYPACRIDSIGGMSYVVDGVIQDSKVTAVKSYGANLLDASVISMSKLQVLADGTLKVLENFNGGFALNFTSPIVLEKGTYYLYSDKTGKIFMMQDTWASATGTSFTINETTSYTGLWISANATFVANETFHIWLTKVNNLPYTPYKGLIDTYTIPSAITSLEGYGQSNPDDPTIYNIVDFVTGKYYEKGYIDNGAWVSKVAEISITEQAPLLECVDSGSIVFENDYNQDMQNEVTTWIKES